MENWTFYIETFGCKVNQYESQQILEAWQKAGGQLVNEPAQADYIFVNSCAITGRAERNARNAIFRLKQLAPRARIVLSGCAAQFYNDFRPRKNANWAAPDYCIPQSGKNSLHSGPPGMAVSMNGETACRPIHAYGRARPVIKIQDGCSQKCAYCIVPYTRGKPQGRKPEEILAECRHLANQGYGELVLSGVNLSQYPGGFWKLLAWLDKELAKDYTGKLRLRPSSIDPAMLNDLGLETISQCRLLCLSLHLSLQHASPDVLRGMGRGHYNMEFILQALAELRKIWPVFGLGADILVGFPGETEEDMRVLLNFLAAIPLTYAHVFPYSARQGTPAKNYPNQIPRYEKEQRASRARELINRKKQKFLRSQLAMPQMLIAPESASQCKGVNEFYTTCVLEQKVDELAGLVAVKPVSVEGDRLLVGLVER